jgi:Fe-S-cluster containining protein
MEESVPKRETLFLTCKEAVEAIRTDFTQYGPQKPLFNELCRVVLGEASGVVKDTGGAGVWLPIGAGRRMRYLDYTELGDHLCNRLETDSPSPDLLAAVCRRVFRTDARPGRSEAGVEGIWIATDMDAFVCRQCGHCCRTLTFHTECSTTEYKKWEMLGRTDITDRVACVRRGNTLISCQIWVTPGTREYVDGCPWLHKIPDQNRYTCTIHDIRPAICRQYPVTRKHAEMTRCIGFSQ